MTLNGKDMEECDEEVVSAHIPKLRVKDASASNLMCSSIVDQAGQGDFMFKV